MYVSSGAEYKPGTPGGAWSQDDLMVVRAKLWRLYGEWIGELTQDTLGLLYSIINRSGEGFSLPLHSARQLLQQVRSAAE